MSGCSVCSNAPARATVDGALLAGMTPKDVWRYHGQDLGLSLSSVYRHARNHKPGNSLSVAWLGDSLSGDLVADLSAQHRSHVQERDRALERGDSAAASREGASALSAAQTLLKIGISDDQTAETIADAGRLIRAVQRATRSRPEYALELAEAAKELRYDDLSDDAQALAASAQTYNESKKQK